MVTHKTCRKLNGHLCGVKSTRVHEWEHDFKCCVVDWSKVTCKKCLKLNIDTQIARLSVKAKR